VVEIDGVRSAVRAGTAVFIPGNAWHSLANTGSEPLRLLYAFPADAMADVHYEFGDRH
jgi:oxalate decarboxylase/phosphoglucose isomerase-like protein (cupin superfamily)